MGILGVYRSDNSMNADDGSFGFMKRGSAKNKNVMSRYKPHVVILVTEQRQY